jgi:TPR repeat protein
LGELYRDGVGVEKDLVQADMWFSLSAHDAAWGADEYQRAIDARRNLEGKMSADQIAKAQQLASDWKPVNTSGN